MYHCTRTLTFFLNCDAPFNSWWTVNYSGIFLIVQQLKLVMDSIIWAFRHTERNIAETGLNLLLQMLKNFQASKFRNQFYRTYFLNIEQEIFGVLIDTFHTPGFKLHVLVLQHLFSLDNKDLYAEEATAERERERQRMLSVLGLIKPNEIQDEMVDMQEILLLSLIFFPDYKLEKN